MNFDVGQKTLGELIDELIVTNLKCWHSQDEAKNANNDADKATFYEKAQRLNVRRNKLITEIDKLSGYDDNPIKEKTYE